MRSAVSVSRRSGRTSVAATIAAASRARPSASAGAHLEQPVELLVQRACSRCRRCRRGRRAARAGPTGWPRTTIGAVAVQRGTGAPLGGSGQRVAGQVGDGDVEAGGARALDELGERAGCEPAGGVAVGGDRGDARWRSSRRARPRGGSGARRARGRRASSTARPRRPRSPPSSGPAGPSARRAAGSWRRRRQPVADAVHGLHVARRARRRARSCGGGSSRARRSSARSRRSRGPGRG